GAQGGPGAGSGLVGLGQGVALERAEKAERRGAMDAELAGDLRSGAPAALGQEVEDGHGAVDRPDGNVVAHSATLSVARNDAATYDATLVSREEEIRAGLFEHTLYGHAPEVKTLTEEALGLGMSPMDILFKALIPSLEEVGRRFEKGDFFVPEMLIAARAMQGALVILLPLIAETGAKPVGRYVIGTVKGDIHDIGKNLCVIMLEGAGFEVFDLGVNTPPEKFVDAVKQHEPDIVGFSAFLTTTMPMFKANIDALTKAGLRDKVHIAVGGAPVTQEYAKHVGADSYAPDASMATRMAKELVGDRSNQSTGAQALEQAVMKIDETLRKG